MFNTNYCQNFAPDISKTRVEIISVNVRCLANQTGGVAVEEEEKRKTDGQEHWILGHDMTRNT